MPPYKKSGGKQCVVVGCKNNQKKVFEWDNTLCDLHEILHKDCPCLQPFRFHCLPVNKEKRRLWLKSINRKDFDPASKSLVCSKHFIDGKPTKENPVPTQCMGYQPIGVTPRRPLVRRQIENEISSLQLELKNENEEKDELLVATPLKSYFQPVISECNSTCCHQFPRSCQNKPVMVDSATQTVDIVQLDHNYGYSKKTRNASCQQTTTEFSLDNIRTDTDSKFYTGLSLTVLLTLVSSLITKGKSLPYKLPAEEQILAVLVRLRLGLTLQDVARRLNVSPMLMTNIYRSWISIMAKFLSDCIIWLPRETIRRSLPTSFQKSYPHTTCIIDCSEIHIQRPFALKARAQTWSTYKGNNTAKFLVSIAPNGFIMFVSALYGGRASDNFISKHSGFLDYLLPGDEVMADRGFTINEELCARRVRLNIPAFMKGRAQLDEEEVIDSRRIAAQRIHVERAIMRMKSYRILNTKLSVRSLSTANQTLQVVSGLCNLRDSLIRDEFDEC